MTWFGKVIVVPLHVCCRFYIWVCLLLLFFVYRVYRNTIKFHSLMVVYNCYFLGLGVFPSLTAIITATTAMPTMPTMPKIVKTGPIGTDPDPCHDKIIKLIREIRNDSCIGQNSEVHFKDVNNYQ